MNQLTVRQVFSARRPKRVIIRAIGPELTQYGITDALANPRLELHNGTGALIATNDNWQTTILYDQLFD